MPALGMKHISRLKVCYGLKKKNHFKGGRNPAPVSCGKKNPELLGSQESLIPSGHLLAGSSSPASGSLKGAAGL